VYQCATGIRVLSDLIFAREEDLPDLDHGRLNRRITDLRRGGEDKIE
jgi:hypothetical protein